MSREVIRYSEAFKIQVVGDFEKGLFKSVEEASRVYGIRGHMTVGKWVKQYGRNHLLKKVVRVEKTGELDELKRLKDRVRKLESALADSHIEGALDKAFFALLCKQQKIDPEAFKKKSMAGGPRSERSQRRSGRRKSNQALP